MVLSRLFGVVLAGCFLAACGTSSTGGSGGGGSGGSGGAGGCTAASDCAAPAADCQVATCSNGLCGTDVAPDGSAAKTQPAGDCKKNVCQAGAAVAQADDTDVPKDAKSCTVDGCDAGSPKTTPEASGAACSESGGKVCDGMGACVECNESADCTGDATKPLCDASVHTCMPIDCTNVVKDGNETDVDCGGLCPGCDDGKVCVVADDCASGVCADSICQVPKCDDGVKNGAETDLDCGGPCAVHCGPDQGCNEDPDCVGAKCSGVGGTCTPNCMDKVTNNGESDVDCGGGACAACGVGKKCNASDADCIDSAFCNAGTCEVKKSQGQMCGGDNQCFTGACADAVCCDVMCAGVCNSCNVAGNVGSCTFIPAGQDPDDECLGNGGTDVCNGAAACGKLTGSACAAGVDCASGKCVDGVCCQSACGAACKACSMAKTGQPDGTCANVTVNTDPDNECVGLLLCTGSGACAAPQADGLACALDAECDNGHCVDGVCCNNVCGGLCQACTAAKKGQGIDGVCGAVKVNTDPDDECAGAKNCNGVGACN
jgi:hypothetical protein